MGKKHRSSKSYGKSFIILPIIFLLGTYLIIFTAFGSTISFISDAAGMVFSDSEKDYSTGYKNIFVPVAENKEGLKAGDIEFPQYGQQFGELLIKDCDINTKLFFGDNDIALRNGVGIYNGSSVPGFGSTVLVGGHNNTYFHNLKDVKKGMTVQIHTNYGNYEYKITDTKVLQEKDSSAYDITADKENLVMYTCYPFDELGLTSQRFFVYADYVSGPQVDTSVEED
ncbi:MAG: class D sortase [Ruminococcus sp.]|nr:class D sortase [Ruminococcus sp.]